MRTNSTDTWEDETTWIPEVADEENRVDIELRQMLREYDDSTVPKRRRRKKGGPRSGNTSRTTARLDIIMRMIDEAKFKSLGHFLWALFSDESHSLNNHCGRFFLQGGFFKVLKLWFSDPRAWGQPEAKTVVIGSVIQWMLEEIKALEQTKMLHYKAKHHELDFMDKVNFQRLHAMYEEKCPILGKFIERGMSQVWVPKDLPDDTSNVTNEAALKGQVSDSDSGESSDGEDEKTAEMFRRRKRGEGTKRRWLIKTTVIGLILYGRSNRLNAFQSIIGYYLHAEGAHRGCIETLHSMGISVSYSFIRRAEIANAEASMRVVLQRINQNKEPFLISWDNVNRMIRVMLERVHSKPYMENWTTVAIIFLDRSGVDLIGPGFPAGWVNLEIRNTLSGVHFMLDEDSINSWPQNCKASIGKVLARWFGSILKKKRSVDGVVQEWKPENAVERQPLKLKKTYAQVLHTLSENEGTTKGTSNVFRQIIEKQLKIDPQLLVGKKILGSADQLSLKLMRIAQFIMDEEAPGKNMDFVEGMIGLFHLRLAVMHMIMRYVL